MIDEHSVTVDNTLISDMICDTKAGLRHVLGYTTKEEAAALKCGQCVHHSQAAYYLVKDGDAAKVAMTMFAKTYKAWADENVDPNDRFSYHNTSRCLHAWYKDHPINKLPFVMKRKYIEQPVKMKLGVIDDKTIWFVGILDGAGLARVSTGLYVVDHKSTRQIGPWWKDGQRTTAQFTGYIVLAQELFGKPVSGVFVNGIGLPQLNSSNNKCPKHKVSYMECATAPEHLKHEIMVVTRTADDIRSWKDTALQSAREFIDLRNSIERIEDIQYILQQGRFRGACNAYSGCEFKGFCDRGRKPHAAKMLLRHEPWNPVEHAEGRQQFADDVAEQYGG